MGKQIQLSAQPPTMTLTLTQLFKSSKVWYSLKVEGGQRKLHTSMVTNTSNPSTWETEVEGPGQSGLWRLSQKIKHENKMPL